MAHSSFFPLGPPWQDEAEDVERKIRHACGHPVVARPPCPTRVREAHGLRYCPVKPEAETSQEDELHLVQDNLKNPCLPLESSRCSLQLLAVISVERADLRS